MLLLHLLQPSNAPEQTQRYLRLPLKVDRPTVRAGSSKIPQLSAPSSKPRASVLKVSQIVAQSSIDPSAKIEREEIKKKTATGRCYRRQKITIISRVRGEFNCLAQITFTFPSTCTFHIKLITPDQANDKSFKHKQD